MDTTIDKLQFSGVFHGSLLKHSLEALVAEDPEKLPALKELVLRSATEGQLPVEQWPQARWTDTGVVFIRKRAIWMWLESMCQNRIVIYLVEWNQRQKPA